MDATAIIHVEADVEPDGTVNSPTAGDTSDGEHLKDDADRLVNEQRAKQNLAISRESKTVDSVSVTSSEPPHHRNRISAKKKQQQTERKTKNESIGREKNSRERRIKQKARNEIQERGSKEHTDNPRKSKRKSQSPKDDPKNWPAWNKNYRKRNKSRRSRRKRKHRQRVSSRSRGSKRRRIRRMSKDRPWSIYFIFVGVILAGISVAGLVLCNNFHQYSSTCASALVILTGILGVLHKRKYTDKCKNYAYISAAVMAYLTVLLAGGMTCNYLTPRMWLMAHALKNDTRYAPLLKIIHPDIVQWMSINNPWLCLGLDLGSLLVLILSLVTCTAAILVLHHFWDASHKWNGKFIPYKRPRWLNPMGQVYIAQVVIFMGFISGSVPLTQKEASLWSPVWTGLVVIVGGVFAICACKRPETTKLVVSSLLLNTLSGLLVATSLGLMISGVIKDAKITTKTEDGKNLMKEFGLPVDNPTINHMEYLFETSLIAFSMSAIVLILTLLFTFGQVVHMFRLLWPSEEQEGEVQDRDRQRERRRDATLVVLVQSTLERVRRRKRRARIKQTTSNKEIDRENDDKPHAECGDTISEKQD